MTLKIGFVGTGHIAQHHLNYLKHVEGKQIISFFDVDQPRAQQTADAHDGAKAYSRLEDLFDGPKLDGVFICLPPMAHGAAERHAIARGIPFFVEKPLGVERELPTALAAEVKAKGLITSVGFHWRYLESSATVRQLLKESKPGMALGYWMGGMPMVPWWRQQNGSGGQFVEQTTHIVDLLRYTCGDVSEVYAAFALRAMGDKVPDTEVPDVGTVTMKLTNGMVATISNSCMLPVDHHVGLDIYTDNGVLEIRSEELREKTPDGVHTRRNKVNPYKEESLAFFHALRTGDTSRILSDYADALRTHVVTIAANESAASGKPVSLA